MRKRYLYLDPPQITIPRRYCHAFSDAERTLSCLAALTRLQSIRLDFRSPRSRPNRTSRRPQPARVVLSALISFRFRGVSEYLEDLVAQIDVPLLNNVVVTFFNQLIFHNPKSLRFLRRAERLKACNQVTMVFFNNEVMVTLSQQTETVNHMDLKISISCTQTDWQLSSLAQICSSTLPHLSTLECLVICEDRRWKPHWQDDVENIQWLELVQLFTAVKDLYLSKDVALRVAPLLQEIAEGSVAEALPTLQNLFLEEPQSSPGPIQEAVEQFVAARQLSGHSVAIHNWERGEMLEN